MTEDRRLTVDAPVAFKMLGYSKNFGYALIIRGEFPCKVIRAGRRIVVPICSLNAILREQSDA